MAEESRATRAFRPGAFISVEGDLVEGAWVIEAGMVEESIGHHVVGRRGPGETVPVRAGRRAAVTTRAITLVHLLPVDEG